MMHTIGTTSAFAANRTPLAALAGAVVPLSEAERQALSELTAASPPVAFRPGQMLLKADTPILKAYVLLSGWTMWHEDLADGSRQIFDFLLPGDTVGFTPLILERASRRHGATSPTIDAPISVTALTDLRAVPVSFAALNRLFERDPELGTLLLSVTALHRFAGMGRRLTNAGRRSARARVADLLLELWGRLRAVGLADENHFELPVTQALFGEILGLTHVHISRTLTGLERDRLVSIITRPRRRVVLHDPEALRVIADSTGRGTDESLRRPFSGSPRLAPTDRSMPAPG